MSAQVLDSMDLERERGITIKSQSVSLEYLAHNGDSYRLNLIDTPGHVDFSYEVSRSLAACDGALLVVDVTQGVEAQSVANCFTAMELDLVILPVLNKIDLPSADPERVLTEIREIIGIETEDVRQVSAKTGSGVKELLETIITKIPPPSGKIDAPLKALIIDSWFDNYLGVVVLVRVIDGCLPAGKKVRIMSTKRDYLVDEVGVFTPKRVSCSGLKAGEVGYVISGIKDLDGAPVGDTLTLSERPASQMLPGFQTVKPKVFAGMYPVDSSIYENFRNALAKLKLNDSALHYEPETSQALGFGFRCGFLGMLHMEIIQERLAREYNLNLIVTAPTVAYEVEIYGGEVLIIDNPAALPAPNKLKEIREPIIYADILTPKDYLGNIITLCIEKRGVQKKLQYLGRQVSLGFELPMNEVVLDFYDRLKSVTRGYASFDYHFLCFKTAALVKLDILINGNRVDALSNIVHRDYARDLGNSIAAKIKELIPKQMFEVAIQAAVGSKIIAKHSVRALRKNVTAKCYGGDVTRKRKLLDKQKAGKKRMTQFGTVEIPQETFMAVLRR